VGAIALFLALFNAPLYHVHEREDHGRTVPLVHAHFPESEDADHHSGVSIEDRHSHANARFVDVFTFATPPAGSEFPAVELTTSLFVPILEDSASVTPEPVPHSHGPPATRHSIPRSPPAS
jgi:hypothetical protein